MGIEGFLQIKIDYFGSSLWASASPRFVLYTGNQKFVPKRKILKKIANEKVNEIKMLLENEKIQKKIADQIKELQYYQERIYHRADYVMARQGKKWKTPLVNESPVDYNLKIPNIDLRPSDHSFINVNIKVEKKPTAKEKGKKIFSNLKDALLQKIGGITAKTAGAAEVTSKPKESGHDFLINNDLLEQGAVDKQKNVVFLEKKQYAILKKPDGHYEFQYKMEDGNLYWFNLKFEKDELILTSGSSIDTYHNLADILKKRGLKGYTMFTPD